MIAREGRSVGARGEAGAVLRRWLEENIDLFLPRVGASAHPVEHMLRLSEMSLILLGMSRRSVAGDECYGAWAKKMACILADGLRAVEEPIVAEFSARSPGVRALLIAFPALEICTATRFRTHDLVDRALESGNSDHRSGTDLELAFARDVAGLHACRATISAEFAKVACGGATSRVMGRRELYDLSHLVFYATRMGRRKPGWNAVQAASVRQRLRTGGAARLRARDLDPAAEAVMGLLMAGFPPCVFVDEATAALSVAAETFGYVPAQSPEAGQMSHRLRHYHSTLVGLSALAEFERLQTTAGR
ncbi:DUF6895 family protein [Actinomadura logoneensis]|uniref:DUF6895 family protein n=1 Tax=Actinomadura logoneensis TaxID=2293572 RepID=UPI0011C0DE2F|nr:hypothetical protein [Actinomadura logoneensis]